MHSPRRSSWWIGSATLVALAAFVAAPPIAAAGVEVIHGGTVRVADLGLDAADDATATSAVVDRTLFAGGAGGGIDIRIALPVRPAVSPAVSLWSAPVPESEQATGRLYARLWREADADAGPDDTGTSHSGRTDWLQVDVARDGILGASSAPAGLLGGGSGGRAVELRLDAIPNPEPGSLVLFALGAAGLCCVVVRRLRRS